MKRLLAYQGLRYLVILVVLLAASFSTLAQSDSTNQTIDEKVLQQENKLNATTDQLDSLISSGAKLDSIQTKSNEAIDKVQSLSSKVANVEDTLSPNLSRYNDKLDSIKNKLTLRIDSLNRLGQPTQKYTQLLDSLQQLGPSKKLDQVKDKVEGVQRSVNSMAQKINKPATQIEGKVNEKLSLMKSEGGEGANLPGNLDLPGISTPGLPNQNTGEPSINLDAPDIQPGLSNPLKETGLEGLPDLKGGVGNIDELNEATKSLGEINEVTNEVSGYGSDVKNITAGNLDEVKELPKSMEAEAVKKMDAGELQGQAQIVEDYKDKLAIGNDPDAMKKEALEQAPKLAMNHFKGQEVVLQQAMDKVSSYKNKYTELTNLKDLPKVSSNKMKGTPFIERLVPGITFQLQRSENVLLDFNPYLGYQISGRFMAGLGWNERVGITNTIGFTSDDRIYGPRTFIDFKVKKGFALKAEVEKMNAFILPNALSPIASDVGNYQWVWSAFVGMKKDYEFMKSIRGNFQFLYNFYDDNDNSPYNRRLMVRFGFEFPHKSKSRKPKEKKEIKEKS